MFRKVFVLVSLSWLSFAQGQELTAVANTPSRASAAGPSIIFNRLSYQMSYVPLDEAFAINNAGAIAGKKGGAAAVYSGGNVIMLPGKAGYTNTIAIDIANNGYIVGSGMSAGHQRALFWASATSPPLDMSALGMFTSPRSINSAGTAVGVFYTTMAALPQAFRWSMTSGMQQITPSGATTAEANDISETGYIAGQAQYTGIGQQAVRWYPNGQVGRITGPAFAQRAMDSGTLIGRSGGVGSVTWDLANTQTPLGPSPGGLYVQQRNSSNRLVGFTFLQPPYGSAWTSINNSAPTYLPMPSGAVASASDVNSCGTILGSVSLPDGSYRPVVWSKFFCDILPPITAQL
jgi:uncharacterized membrane protein